MKVEVFALAQSGPDNLRSLVELIETGRLVPKTIVAILGKAEGNGGVNDFTRGFAVATLQAYLRPLMGDAATEQIMFVMPGGTEGVLSPHMTVFTRQSGEYQYAT